MADETAVKNGATSKSNSQLPNTPIPVSGRVSPDLENEIANLKTLLKLKTQQRDAEATAAREAKRNAKQQATQDEIYGLKCRVYRAFHAAKDAGPDFLALALAIATEFKTNSVDQQFTIANMNKVRDARIAADGEMARLKLAKIAAAQAKAAESNQNS